MQPDTYTKFNRLGVYPETCNTRQREIYNKNTYFLVFNLAKTVGNCETYSNVHAAGDGFAVIKHTDKYDLAPEQ